MLLKLIVFNLRENKNLSLRDISVGKNGLKFITENISLIEEIKALSKLKENEGVDIKVIYDRIKLISKKDWDNIISIGEKTKIFGYGELSNLKSIRNSLNKNEIIKELSIEKGYESLRKLSSFGINV